MTLVQQKLQVDCGPCMPLLCIRYLMWLQCSAGEAAILVSMPCLSIDTQGLASCSVCCRYVASGMLQGSMLAGGAKQSLVCWQTRKRVMSTRSIGILLCSRFHVQHAAYSTPIVTANCVCIVHISYRRDIRICGQCEAVSESYDRTLSLCTLPVQFFSIHLRGTSFARQAI